MRRRELALAGVLVAVWALLALAAISLGHTAAHP